jgi:endonuclease-3
MSRILLSQVVEQLRVFYGEPEPLGITDPWEMIVWENVAYLVDDRHRQAAMTALREGIGVRPEQIMAASAGQLSIAVVRGIVPEQSVEKLRHSAEIALEQFGGNLRSILKRPLAQAKKDLKRFPSIGDPGAEKILLFCHAFPIMALDSNGLRVLLRLGFGEEKPNYAATYRLMQESIAEEVIKEYHWLQRAYQLLRQHGQELCKRSQPHCGKCPLRAGCPWPDASAGT